MMNIKSSKTCKTVKQVRDFQLDVRSRLKKFREMALFVFLKGKGYRQKSKIFMHEIGLRHGHDCFSPTHVRMGMWGSTYSSLS